MRWRTKTIRVSEDLHRALKAIAHQRRISVEQLQRDHLHALAVQEGQPVCIYCEPGDRRCPGHGICHCGCEQPTEVAAKFIGDHHSRRVPLVGS